MLEQIKLIITALRVTTVTPLLWFFGLLLSAGFNMNFWYLKNMGLYELLKELLGLLVSPSRNDPVQVFSIIIFLFVVAVLMWVLANWVKIFFILSIADIMKVDRLGQFPKKLLWAEKQNKILQLTKKYLPSVLIVSLFTVIAQIVAVLVFASPWIWQKFFAPVEYMTGAGAVLLVLFLFILSLFNFFAVANIVLYQKNTNDACSLAWQFIKIKLIPLSFFCFMLLVFYAVGTEIGLILFTSITVALILWLGFLNAFFNFSLFLFYVNNLKPRSFEKKTKVVKKVLSHELIVGNQK